MRYFLLAVVFVAIGCADVADTQSSATLPDATLPAETPKPQVDYSEGPVVTIASTTHIGILNKSLSEGLSVVKVYAVRSESHDFAHYLAAHIHGIDGDDDIGIWFMFDGMDIPGEGFSVNQLAIESSSFKTFSSEQDIDYRKAHEVERLMELVEQL